VGLGRQILHESLHSAGFRGGVCGVDFGGVWSVGLAGKWADHWAIFAPNALSLSGFPGLKNLSQKCLFLKSLVLRELSGFAERVLNKLKRGGKERKREEERGRERKREEERRRGGDKETKRQRDKKRKRGRERKGEEEEEGERRKDRFFET
ncbi:hypothetical protein, partial [Prevotellamassilia timonensis]|uniref:hypothetical protein n=1 Tax=Prevotellamassilia timonensis TaxID=1852370 RepID=UPI001F40773B